MSSENTVRKFPIATDEDGKPRTISGTCDITVNLSDRRGVKMTFYLYSDDTKEEVNKRMDEAQDVLDRQLIRIDLVNKEAQIASHTENLKALKKGYEGLVSEQQKGRKMTSQQKLQMENFGLQELQIVDTIASLRAAIDEGKRKLAAP